MANISTRVIQIKTEVPGPKSKELLARREAAIPKGWSRSTQVVAASAHGALVTDVDGNVFIDFASGIGVLAVGHTPAPVVDAIKLQAETLINLGSMIGTTESMVALAEKLNQITPGKFAKKTVISNTGAEAVENAIRTAREYTKRSGVICFESGYHGRSLLTASLTSKYDSYKKNFGPFASDIYKLPFPYVYRRPEGLSEDQFTNYLIDQFDYAFNAQVDPENVAAVILEPVQGEGGFIVTPVSFMRHVAKRCKEYGIVFIIDEVQTGFGRTGKLFALEHYNEYGDVEADIIVIAKSLGGGMPISAITGRAEIMEAVHVGGYGGTYGGNPVACAAALAAINMIERENFADRAVRLAEIIRGEFERWQRDLPMIGDIRGLGAMLAMELVTDPKSKTPAKDQCAAIITEAAKRGVLLIKAGMHSNCIRLLVPLMIPEEQLYEGLEALEGAVRSVLGK